MKHVSMVASFFKLGWPFIKAIFMMARDGEITMVEAQEAVFLMWPMKDGKPVTIRLPWYAKSR